MIETLRATPSRGFTCAVARVEQLSPGQAIGAVAIGIDDSGDDRRYLVSIRHADGTMLTADLSEALLDRLARIQAAAVEGNLGAPIGGIQVVQ